MSRKAVVWAVAGTGVAALAVILFLSLGFRLFAIQTPSMGQAAPVGTLVVTHSAASYSTGDFISFDRTGRVYTHRIIGVGGDGSFTTKGDLNGGPDPLPVAPADVIGKAVWIAPGLGWLMQGLPWLALGFIAVYAASLLGRLPRPWRWAIRISGWTLAISLVAFWLRPWINLEMLGYVPADDQGVLMHVVNTGLFPLDASGTRLVSGQDAVIHVTEQNAAGYFTLTPAAALSLLQRILVFLVCLIPLGSALLIRVDPPPAHVAAAESAPAESASSTRTRPMLIALVVAVVVVSIAAINQSMAYGALTVRIQNSQNTAGSRTFFNCRNAVTNTVNATPYAAWALGTARGTGSNEADLTGNGRTGRYTTAATVNSSVGCNWDTPKAAVLFDGDKCLYMNAGYASSGHMPNIFSLEAWFRTGTKSNGKIIGFGNIRNASNDGNYDRHIYLDKDGRIVFGVYPNTVRIVYTAAGKNYADNQWHHVVATLSSAGQRLYVDGELVMSNTAVTSAEALHGYWKVGCGTLSGWRNAATDASGSTTNDYNGPPYFTGWIQYAAVYTSVLNATQVKEHYQAGLA